MTTKLSHNWLLMLPVLLVGCGLVKRDPAGEAPWSKRDSMGWFRPGSSNSTSSAADENRNDAGERADADNGASPSPRSAAPSGQAPIPGEATEVELDRSIQDSILTLIDNTDDPELKRMLIGNMHSFYGNRTPEELKRAIQEEDDDPSLGNAAPQSPAPPHADSPPIGTGARFARDRLSDSSNPTETPANPPASLPQTRRSPDARHALRAEQERQRGEQMLAELQGTMNGMAQRQLGSQGDANPIPISESLNHSMLSQIDDRQPLSSSQLDESTAPARYINRGPQGSAIERDSDQALDDSTPVPLGRWKQHLMQTIATLEAAQHNPQRSLTLEERTNAEITLRFLYMLTANREKALQPIEGYSETQNAYWKEQLFALSELIHANNIDLESTLFTTNTHRNAIAVQHERQALGHLADTAMLQIRNLNLCRSIDGFGAFETFPSMTFEKNQKVLVYCELENLTARETVGAKYQQFESELRGTVTIQDQNRKVVGQTTYETVRDVCRNRRLDFYVYFEWQVPSDLPTGDYFLQVTVEDRLGDKTSSSPAPISFRVR